jgi:hypothetical protein
MRTQQKSNTSPHPTTPKEKNLITSLRARMFFCLLVFFARGMNHGRIFFEYFAPACYWVESCNLFAEDYCLAAFVVFV